MKDHTFHGKIIIIGLLALHADVVKKLPPVVAPFFHSNFSVSISTKFVLKITIRLTLSNSIFKGNRIP